MHYIIASIYFQSGVHHTLHRSRIRINLLVFDEKECDVVIAYLQVPRSMASAARNLH